MGLILRTSLTRPLTHKELDGNFTFVNIAPWVKKGYSAGQYVTVNVAGNTAIYYCNVTHTDFVYNQNGGNFSETYNSLTLWTKIGGNVVTGMTYNQTTQTITLSDGQEFSVDLNETELSNEQYAIGISNHSFQNDFDIDTTTISGTTYNIAPIRYGASLPAAKLNIIVVNSVTGDDGFLLKLPTGLTLLQAGIIYRVIVKEISIPIDKYFMVFSDTKRVLSPLIRTKVGSNYFLPLEVLESVDFIWDGYDFLVTNLVKQPYVALNAKTFINLNNDIDPLFVTDYIERDINSLI
jgi:hypothetical protein